MKVFMYMLFSFSADELIRVKQETFGISLKKKNYETGKQICCKML